MSLASIDVLESAENCLEPPKLYFKLDGRYINTSIGLK